MSFRLFRFLVCPLIAPSICILLGLSASQQACGQETQDAKPAILDGPNKQQIDKLTQLLTRSRWTGQFTTLRPGGREDAAKKETYEISKAEKLTDGDLWMLTTRIKYGKRDVTVPLPINILWAGETPVITVDQLLIPGLGTFDARVLIRGGKYSGTWTHNDHGGHLFGKIEKMEAETK